MDEQNIDILERIHASFYQLTAAERKVADYVLAQHHQVQFMSITQLAEECGVAEATISRFCRSLKLKGFNAFKIALARHSAPHPALQQQHNTDADTLTGRCMECAQLATDAVHQTISLLDPARLQQALEYLEQAGQVLCFGSGGSMLMAQEFAHLFSNVSGKFRAISDAHMQMVAAATAGENDVLVLFSYSGATTNGLQLLEYARARGLHTILVTRFRKSPAAKLANVVLCCGSNEGPFQFGSVPARIAQLVLTDVLFQEYCRRNQADCERNIQSIASALSDMHI